MATPLRRLVCLTCLLLLAGNCAAIQKRPLEAHLTELVGPRARDCGRLGVVAGELEVRSAIDCVQGAWRNGAVATAIQMGPGVDSRMAFGLATTKGELVKFTYDSAPCGGPNCREIFASSACNGAPKVVHRPPRFVIDCDVSELQVPPPSGDTRLRAVVEAARERIEFHVGKVEVFVIDAAIDDTTAAVLTREFRAIPSTLVRRTAMFELPAGYFLLKSIRFRGNSATVTGTMGPIPSPRDGVVLLACGTTLLIDVTETPEGWVGKVSSLTVC